MKKRSGTTRSRRIKALPLERLALAVVTGTEKARKSTSAKPDTGSSAPLPRVSRELQCASRASTREISPKPSRRNRRPSPRCCACARASRARPRRRRRRVPLRADLRGLVGRRRRGPLGEAAARLEIHETRPPSVESVLGRESAARGGLEDRPAEPRTSRRAPLPVPGVELCDLVFDPREAREPPRISLTFLAFTRVAEHLASTRALRSAT